MDYSDCSSNFCFICKKSSYPQRNIQEIAFESLSFLDVIETLSGISFDIQHAEEYVQEICLECQEHAIVSYRFQQDCIKSVESFVNFIELDTFENEEFIDDDSSIIEYDTVIEQSEIECEEQEVIEEYIIQEEISALDEDISPKQKDRKIQFEKTIDGRFKCLKCDNSFKTKDILRRHFVRHTKTRMFKCSLCPREFFFQRDLNFHSKTHQNLDKLICEYCQNGYSSKSALKKHVLIHKDVRQFKCNLEECGKQFRTKFSLNNHMLIHTKTKPFECRMEGCGQKFTQKNILIRHMISSHQMNYYECEYCKNESFEKHKDLRIHWTTCQSFQNLRSFE